MTNTELTPYILTADVGGSHITSAICNTDTSTILEETIARVEFSSKDTAENILTAWEKCFKLSLQSMDEQVSGVGLSMPGPLDYENGISYITGLDKFEALYGLNIKEYLAGHLGMDATVIKFRNDAEASIAGEVWAHFGKQYQNIIGVTLGTGFGSAHYSNGVTKDVNWGSDAYKDSIADDYFSTRWFVKRYFELTGNKVYEAKELLLNDNDKEVVAGIFKEFAHNMAEFLTPRINELKPELMIICGNIAKSADLFLPHLKEHLNPLPIELAILGEKAALFGAASLFENLNAS